MGRGYDFLLLAPFSTGIWVSHGARVCTIGYGERERGGSARFFGERIVS